MRLFDTLVRSIQEAFFQFKSSRGFGRSVVGAAGTPTWVSLEYKSYVNEGYKSLVWVYRCVREIAEAVSSVPWEVYEVQPDGTERPLPGHALEKLLKAPNRIMDGTQLFEAWSVYLLLAGTAFFEIVRRGENNDQGEPLELFPLRPDLMKIVPDPDHFIREYILEVQGEKISYRPDELVHWKFIDPLNEYRGMPPIQAGARIIDTENSAISWNKVMLQNAAQPSGALIVPEGKRLSPMQKLNLKEQIENKFSRANAHRPMLLESGMKWEQMSVSQRDMEFSKQRLMNAQEICALFGVPPEVVGAGERPKFENYKIARLSFWEETVINLLEKIRAGLNMRVAILYGDNIRVRYNVRNVPAMREVFKEKIETAQKLQELGFSLNAINTHLDLGFDAVPWGDEPIVPGTMVPISAVLSGETLDSGPTNAPKRLTEPYIQKALPSPSKLLEAVERGRQRALRGGV